MSNLRFFAYSILTGDEALKLDFKARLFLNTPSQRSRFARDVSAMANIRRPDEITSYMVIGVPDKKEVECRFEFRPKESTGEVESFGRQLQQILDNYLQPPLNVGYCEEKFRSVGVGIISVEDPPFRPVRLIANGLNEIWVRRGINNPKSDYATPHEMEEMWAEWIDSSNINPLLSKREWHAQLHLTNIGKVLERRTGPSVFLTKLLDGSPEIRMAAISALSQMDEPKLIIRWGRHINDEELPVVRHTIDCLCTWKNDQRAKSFLLTALEHCLDQEAKAHAARALSKIDGPDVVSKLFERAIRDSIPEVRLECIRSLKHHSALLELQQLLTSENENDLLEEIGICIMELEGSNHV